MYLSNINIYLFLLLIPISSFGDVENNSDITFTPSGSYYVYEPNREPHFYILELEENSAKKIWGEDTATFTIRGSYPVFEGIGKNGEIVTNIVFYSPYAAWVVSEYGLASPIFSKTELPEELLGRWVHSDPFKEHSEILTIDKSSFIVEDISIEMLSGANPDGGFELFLRQDGSIKGQVSIDTHGELLIIERDGYTSFLSRPDRSFAESVSGPIPAPGTMFSYGEAAFIVQDGYVELNDEYLRYWPTIRETAFINEDGERETIESKKISQNPIIKTQGPLLKVQGDQEDSTTIYYILCSDTKAWVFHSNEFSTTFMAPVVWNNLKIPHGLWGMPYLVYDPQIDSQRWNTAEFSAKPNASPTVFWNYIHYGDIELSTATDDYLYSTCGTRCRFFQICESSWLIEIANDYNPVTLTILYKDEFPKWGHFLTGYNE
ncbi:hypothetical protein CHISP_0936 [Chitinispirillum alkaliphilum]|nr:hypothetical protein CHISP_0936 [Chitinispirillum alkaliphilum]